MPRTNCSPVATRPGSYSINSFQMMFGVNAFSCAFTLWTLLQVTRAVYKTLLVALWGLILAPRPHPQLGTLWSSLNFVLACPQFAIHFAALSICSATGQIFIFRTLSLYGALVFAIIMTWVTRVLFSGSTRGRLCVAHGVTWFLCAHGGGGPLMEQLVVLLSSTYVGVALGEGV